jgi:hypothetical protein
LLQLVEKGKDLLIVIEPILEVDQHFPESEVFSIYHHLRLILGLLYFLILRNFCLFLVLDENRRKMLLILDLNGLQLCGGGHFFIYDQDVHGKRFGLLDKVIGIDLPFNPIRLPQSLQLQEPPCS